MLVHFHGIVGREANCNSEIEFAHKGSVFLVWHRHYLLFLERELQLASNNNSFGLPYWNWEDNYIDLFSKEHFGEPGHVETNASVNVTGTYLNTDTWHTVCDSKFRNKSISCGDLWKLCNPNEDRTARRPLQRGGTDTKL
ncbi:tyrosinase family protein, partial [Salmonella sp. s51228]|uniref:tyrosinase family protein n=1 Tax=Salmonella sp. s51228 TaxID=3159652 RepID=UPI00397F2FC8